MSDNKKVQLIVIFITRFNLIIVFKFKIKKAESRLDKHKKRFIEIKKNAKSNRAVTMAAAGGK